MRIILLLMVALTSFGIAGCGASSTKENSTNDSDKKNDHDSHDHGAHDHGAHDHKSHGHGDQKNESAAMKKMEEGLSKLSAEDKVLASKQHTCPVSGDMLGTMGKPIKVSIKGTDVWICCNGCKKELEKNPDEFIAKLKKK